MMLANSNDLRTVSPLFEVISISVQGTRETLRTRPINLTRDTKRSYSQLSHLVILLKVGRFSGTRAQQAFMIIAKSVGDSAGIFRRSSLITTCT